MADPVRAGRRRGSGGNIFATVSVMFVRVLKGANDFVGVIDFEQRQDFLHMMAGIEAALLKLLVVVRCLRAETQEAVQTLLVSGSEPLFQ